LLFKLVKYYEIFFSFALFKENEDIENNILILDEKTKGNSEKLHFGF